MMKQGFLALKSGEWEGEYKNTFRIEVKVSEWPLTNPFGRK